MTQDALAFWQAYVREMISIGGDNLPKTISSRLGAKLARVYKNKGINAIKEALIESYKVLNGNPEIKKEDKHLEIKIHYHENFCPIGGKPEPGKAKIIQESVCVPYTIGFLSELDPRFKYKAVVHSCVLNPEDRVCKYSLEYEEKD